MIGGSGREAHGSEAAAGERGRAWRAFAQADRRCRRPGASVQDYLSRAESLATLGEPEGARADVALALEMHPEDVSANRAALRWGDGPLRRLAAGRLVASEVAGDDSLASAVAVLLEEGETAVSRARPFEGGFRGWIVWRSGVSASIRATGRSGSVERLLFPQPAHRLRGPGYSAADWTCADVDDLTLVIGGRDVATFRRPVPVDTGGDRRASAVPGEAPFTAIVPIHDGYEETRVCLEALFAQRGAPIPVILVDDASPDPRIGPMLEAAARRPGVTVLRNAVNLGFARSVNRALALCASGDALLLNSDTVPPPGALHRLAAHAHAESGVGTATPFSNNSQHTSYPAPEQAFALPDVETIAELDAAAARANGARLVDLPNGIGFCMLITRACLDALPRLPDSYGRGYYEDVEYCLAARERGFRNVCVAGVYIGHAGSASFKDDKVALAMRNEAILGGRVPERLRETLGLVWDDPLAKARARIDEYAPPPRGAALLLADEGVATWHARRRAEAIVEAEGKAAVVASISLDRALVVLRRVGKGGPRELVFAADADGLARADGYLRRLAPSRVEIFESACAPDAFLELVSRLGAPIDLRGVELWSRPGGEPDLARETRLAALVSGAREIHALDRMGEAVVHRNFATRPIAPTPRALARSSGDRLGVLAPWPSVAVDRLLTALGRRLARSAGGVFRLFVFGACVNEQIVAASGAVFVLGPCAPGEYVELCQRYRIGRLAVFDRQGFFGVLDECAAAVGAPKAYFDLSMGAVATEPGDLALDSHLGDREAAEAIAAWLDAP